MDQDVFLTASHSSRLQYSLLRDECGHGSGGGQGRDNAARPGHEEDGAVRRQAARRAGQWQRGHETFGGAAQREEMCMLDGEAVQETTSQALCRLSFLLATFRPLFPPPAIFDCMFVHPLFSELDL